MQKKRLVLVAHDVGGVGGMEAHLEEMIRRLKEEYEVTVVSASLKIADRGNVHHIRVPVIHRPFPIMALMFALYASLRVKLMSKKAIIHTTGAIVLCKVDVCTVHFCHAGWYRDVGNRGRSKQNSFLNRLNHALSVRIKLGMERFSYRPSRTGALVAVSERVRRELAEAYPYQLKDIFVVPNGVDTQRFFPATDSEKQVLRRKYALPEIGTYLVFVGGDWERKGVEYLLAGFDQLTEIYPELQVLIVGAGDTKAFANYVQERSRQRVHFVGKQKNPEVFYRLSDIFVFPSNYEACSLAVLEAAASGIAMIVTNVGGAEDIVQDGISGYFVMRSANEIASKIRYLLDNPEIRRQMSRAVRQKVEQETWGSTYQQFSNIYSRLTDTEKPQKPLATSTK